MSLTLEWHRPHLYAAQEDAIFTDSRFAAVEASTKSGKSVGCLAWIIEEALAGPGDGAVYTWVSPAYSLSQHMYRRTVRMLGPDAVTATNQSDLSVTLANGAVVWFRSGDRPHLVYGFDTYGAVLDEASRVPEEVWHALRSTLSATKGRARLIGNVAGRTWFWRLCRAVEKGELPGWTYSRLTYEDAVAAGVLDPADIAEAKRSLPEPIFRMLYNAELPREGTAFFATERINTTADAPEPGRSCRAWDLATGATRGDYTVGALLQRAGDTATVLDLVRGRWPAETVLEQIVTTAHADGPGVAIAIEQEKGSAGKLLAESIRRRLAESGWKGKLHSVPITGDKQTRAFGLAGCIGAGDFWLIEAAWNDQVWIELDSFPSEEHDDVVDALSLAYNFLDSAKPPPRKATYTPPQAWGDFGGVDPINTLDRVRGR